MCEPFPITTPLTNAVTRFPMKVEKKKARESDCAVNVISFTSPDDDESWVVLVRRPETGLLAGLYEFPTLPVDDSESETLDDASKTLLKTYLSGRGEMVKKTSDAGSLLHVFSHIRMTYHIRNVKLASSASSSDMPELRQVSESEVARLVPGANEDDDDAGSEADEDEKPVKKRKTAGKAKATKPAPNSLPRVRWVRAADVEQEK